jgi:hypothetical protein
LGNLRKKLKDDPQTPVYEVIIVTAILRTFKGVLGAGLLALCIGGVSSCDLQATSRSDGTVANPKPHGETIGLVLSDSHLIYQAKDDKADCPDGFRNSDRQNWEAQFPTKAARQRQMNQCGEIYNRGPNCEDVWHNPQAVQDPLPFREVKGKVAEGVDLDGVGSGVATAQTCPHEDFTSPDGKSGIDNQYYRFLGCVRHVRETDEDLPKKLIEKAQVYRLLLEVSGVDNQRDDPAVEVAMYLGRDPLVVDDRGNAVPWQSQRIDEGTQLFRARGKIVSGELITEPSDVFWISGMYERRLLIRGMSLRLKLMPTGATGLRVGYIDVDQLWQSYSSYMASWGFIFQASGPSDYAAMHRLADGYKDPKTGVCSALSSARRLEFVRVHVVHPSQSNESLR